MRERLHRMGLLLEGHAEPLIRHDVGMPYAVELYLDAAADQQVREMWAALDAVGVPSLGSSPAASHHPHVTLAAFDDMVIERAAEELLPAMADCVGLELRLASLGFFMSESTVAFLGVVPTECLLGAHRQVVAAAEPIVSGYWPHYLPNALVPHCTLTMQVNSLPEVVEGLKGFGLPVLAHVGSVHLVEVLTGESLLSSDGN